MLVFVLDGTFSQRVLRRRTAKEQKSPHFSAGAHHDEAGPRQNRGAEWW